MSLGEADGTLPTEFQSYNEKIAPSPTRENPGAVYPKSSPTAASPQEVPGSDAAPSNPRSVISNPYEFEEKLVKAEGALRELIDELEGESRDYGVSEEEVELIKMFGNWIETLERIRLGRSTTRRQKREVNRVDGNEGAREGGLFTD